MVFAQIVRHAPFQLTAARRRLGFQVATNYAGSMFQLTAARRRLESCHPTLGNTQSVSTHSRPKAAGWHFPFSIDAVAVSTHSRPKAAGFILIGQSLVKHVSTHSRPKAADKFFQ